MPTVRFNEQSFTLDGRRIWVLGATIHYARIPAGEWPEVIARTRDAGCNTVEVPCPWMVHEPRRGRYDFSGDANVAEFVRLCGEAGLWVMLRPGPAIGSGYDGGGIPGWVNDDPAVSVRESSEGFLERATRYLRRLMNELSEFQMPKGGPILLVQAEHEWCCANPIEEQKYLHEVGRVLRESASGIPIVNANNLWPDAQDTIDTWRGRTDLLANVRQLRVVQPTAPRLVSSYEVSRTATWGAPAEAPMTPDEAVRGVAEILAAGAQLVISPFHAGTNLGFLGGRMPGHGEKGDGFVTTNAADGAPLDEASNQTDTYRGLRRLLTFANNFQSVFGDLDPEYHPVVVDPHCEGSGISVAPLRGSAGRIIFVFGHGRQRTATLVLDHGGRVPVNLGDQPVGWYVVDVDINGRGRLDYSNLCPFAIVGRTLVVLQGASGSDALISVNGTPLRAAVPTGTKPRVLEHMGLTFLICNQKQIDVTYVDPKAEVVHMGITGFDAAGAPITAPGWSRPVTIAESGAVTAIANAVAASTRRSRAKALKDWSCSSALPYADGSSPRYASLPGPATLASCGANAGYGWYRIKLKSTATKEHLVVAPGMAHRLHAYRDGALATIAGEGPGADTGAFKLRLRKGENVLCGLVDNFGRFCDGNDMGVRTGLHDHLYAVKAKVGVRSKIDTAAAVDPFAVRGLILGASRGTLSSGNQIVWEFSHTRKAPIIVEVRAGTVSGTIVLNDEPIAYFAGTLGAGHAMLVLDPAHELFRRGKNVVRFAPDQGQDEGLDEMRKAIRVHEVTANLTDGADWSFAKWEPPAATRFKATNASEAAAVKGAPSWWKCRFDAHRGDGPRSLDTNGLSKGQVFVNGHNVGRYFTALSTGKAVGPQTKLHIPASWLAENGDNELLVFDEHGFSPLKTKLI